MSKNFKGLVILQAVAVVKHATTPVVTERINAAAPKAEAVQYCGKELVTNLMLTGMKCTFLKGHRGCCSWDNSERHLISGAIF